MKYCSLEKFIWNKLCSSVFLESGDKVIPVVREVAISDSTMSLRESTAIAFKFYVQFYGCWIF